MSKSNSMPHTSCTVVAVDMHPIILESLQRLIADSGWLQLIGTATDGIHGLQLIRRNRPNLAIVDINLGGLDGLEIARRVRAQQQNTAIVMTSGGDQTQDSRLALLAGAYAYVNKSESTALLIAALQLASRGFFSFPVHAVDLVTLKDSSETLAPLTRRELRVNQLLAQGLRNTEIATRMGISPKTVSTFKQRILKKLGPDQ